MKPVHDMTIEALVAENKSLMADEAKSRARRAEISEEVTIRQAAGKLKATMDAMPAETRAKLAERMKFQRAGAE